jgi:hypothetical protein
VTAREEQFPRQHNYSFGNIDGSTMSLYKMLDHMCVGLLFLKRLLDGGGKKWSGVACTMPTTTGLCGVS